MLIKPICLSYIVCLIAGIAMIPSKVVALGPPDDAETVGNGVGTLTSRQEWWALLDAEEKQALASLFEADWFENEIDEDTRIAFAYTARQIYDFLDSGIDSDPTDFYNGFAPLLLRSSFHGAGTYVHETGVGGSNGGTIFNHAELADPANGCIGKSSTELFSLFHGNPLVSLADTMVIAGVVALDFMNFPRMDLVAITGGRATLKGTTAHVGSLPSADDDPMVQFTQQYDLTMSQAVALAGGAHNFGSAHGKCSGYIGQWTATPLNWYGPSSTAPTFFSDLLRDDWRWYEVCTYENNTVSYVSIDDPFTLGAPEEEEEENDEPGACSVEQSLVPLICEGQAMRGCFFEDGNYPLDVSPCDIDLLQMRLKSDFFLKANPAMLPFAEAFAADPDLLAEEFAVAYHKVTHNGLDRCGLSGHGCVDGHTCQLMGDNAFTATCISDQQNDELVSSSSDLLLNDVEDEDTAILMSLTATTLGVAALSVILAWATLFKLNQVLGKISDTTKLHSSTGTFGVKVPASDGSFEENYGFDG